jgi:hypothetical protein
MSKTLPRFEKAISEFDLIHREDPVTAVRHGAKIPRALLYHERLSHWVDKLEPNASVPLQLAARCQHLRRWTIPRASYPEGLAGYRHWRSTLTDFHVQEASSILREVGYDDATIGRVQQFLTKKDLKRNAEVQLFEDAICLVFFETELTNFSGKHDKDRLIRILRKVWMKMSLNGRENARHLAKELPVGLQDLLDEAIFAAT